MSKLQKDSIIWTIVMIVILFLAFCGINGQHIICVLIYDFILYEIKAEIVIGGYALAGIVIGVIIIIGIIILYYIIRSILRALN